MAPPPKAEDERDLLNYPPILRRILINRGYGTPEAAQEYLEARSPAGTASRNLSGMSAAVDRIRVALHQEEPIVIYGDYDVDGVTATALLCQVLLGLNADVHPYIPKRLDEGYGLNNEALDVIHSGGARLVITVDCGIRSPGEAQHAHELGLDLIITDHHQPAASLPEACAVICPKQPGDTYGEKELSGVGLAYKLACALLGEEDAHHLASLLDLVTLGTVADLVPLLGENRALVRVGLEYLRTPQRQGLLSLMGVAGLAPQKISAGDIGYVLGPRLNAAGRLDSALAALRLLLTQDVTEAGQLAQQLDVQNRQRQQLTEQIQKHAEQLALEQAPDSLLLFAAHRDYNPGVVGLAAARLTELYYRPAIVAYQGEEFTRGSCRSIPELHITQVLDQCADLLDHHGGHAAAAGFTVTNRNLPALVERLHLLVNKQLTGRDLCPVLRADAELRLSDLKPDLLGQLKRIEPTGQSNPAAAFVSRGLRITGRRAVGRDNAHLKLTVTDGRITYDAIAFRQGHWIDRLPPTVDLLYSFEVSEYNGRSYLQLNVRDLKPAGVPD